MVFDSYLYSACGERDINEDYISEKTLLDGKLFIVADGLGGHLHGNRASKFVTDSLLNSRVPSPDEDIGRWLSNAIIDSNRQLLDLIAQSKSIMKSTVAALSIVSGKAYCAHTGDTRIYFFRNGEIGFITNDHSVAYRKFKSGEITRDMIASDVDQPSLLRVLGNEDRFEPDLSCITDKILTGDSFLLCTDGFWEYIRDEEILIDLLKSNTAQEWASLMLLRVMENIKGNNDNISIITIRIH